MVVLLRGYYIKSETSTQKAMSAFNFGREYLERLGILAMLVHLVAI